MCDNLPIYAGFDRRREVVQGAPVGHDVSLKPPTFAQCRLEQILVRAGGDSVDFGERAHDGRRLSILDSHLEGQQVQLV